MGREEARSDEGGEEGEEHMCAEVDRLRAKKKQIYEELCDDVEQIDLEKFKELCEALDSAEEKAVKKKNQRKYKW
jgi:hypothetical protein